MRFDRAPRDRLFVNNATHTSKATSSGRAAAASASNGDDHRRGRAFSIGARGSFQV